MAAQSGCEIKPAFKRTLTQVLIFKDRYPQIKTAGRHLKFFVKIVLILNRADDSAIFKEMFWPQHLDGCHYLCNHIHARPLNVI